MRYLFAVVVVVVIASVRTSVAACTCGEFGGSPTAEEQFEVSHAVFSARVTGIEQPEDEHDLVVTLSVSDCWKGSVAADVAVRTAATAAECGVDFQPGVDYLVYAYSSRNG